MPQTLELENLLLRRLPTDDYRQLAGALERVQIPLKQVMFEPQQPIRYAYFPVSGVASSLILLEDGSAVESSTIGREGMLGMGLTMTQSESPFRVIQQIAGESDRIPANDFRRALGDSAALREIVQRYILTVVRQTAQNSACNLHHSVESRMCRWVLASADRVGDDEFDITQEFLAEMLGATRQTVNLTARLLQRAGLIAYRRGHLTIADRAGMQQSACECYDVMKHAYEWLLLERSANPD